MDSQRDEGVGLWVGNSISERDKQNRDRGEERAAQKETGQGNWEERNRTSPPNHYREYREKNEKHQEDGQNHANRQAKTREMGWIVERRGRRNQCV